MNVLIFLIILLILVISHEFGHFIVAKKSGIRVDEFSFGFPPKLFGKKFGETSYNFNLLPFGGYVKIFGENPDEDSINGPDKNRSFVNKPRHIQAAVLVAGVVMNFLVAWLLLTVGFLSGLPTSVSVAPQGSIIKNQALTITNVVPNSPAEKAGLKTGDKIISLNNTKADLNIETVQSFIKSHDNEEVKVLVERAKDQQEIVVVPETGKDSDVPMIGISMDVIGMMKLPVHKALFEGLKLSWQVTEQTVLGFYNLIKGAIMGQGNMSSITGPVGIVGVVGDAAKFGFVYLLSFTALISINLAVINLIPFPALDGGRLLFLLIEKIKGSRIKPQISNMVNMVGFGLLMLLMAIITYNDIAKLL